MRKLWCNARECSQSELKEHAEDISDLESFEVMLREAAQKSYPENVDILQSGRVLELQNRNLWIRPTDLSWNVPILVTIRELLFKNYRGKSIANLEDRCDAKKQNSEKQKGQIKHTGLRLRSNISFGNEILYIDFPSKVFHSDETDDYISPSLTPAHLIVT